MRRIVVRNPKFSNIQLCTHLSIHPPNHLSKLSLQELFESVQCPRPSARHWEYKIEVICVYMKVHS